MWAEHLQLPLWVFLIVFFGSWVYVLLFIACQSCSEGEVRELNGCFFLINVVWKSEQRGRVGLKASWKPWVDEVECVCVYVGMCTHMSQLVNLCI